MCRSVLIVINVCLRCVIMYRLGEKSPGSYANEDRTPSCPGSVSFNEPFIDLNVSLKGYRNWCVNREYS
jgi:hypothetical protein